MPVKKLRERLGLSYTELAKALDLGSNGARLIRRFENGQTTPSPMLLKLLRYIEIYGDIDDE